MRADEDGSNGRRAEPKSELPTVCPRCGCEDFFIVIDQRNTTQFRLCINSKGEKDVCDVFREYSDHNEFARVRCLECGAIVGNRYDYEAAGWPIPI